MHLGDLSGWLVSCRVAALGLWVGVSCVCIRCLSSDDLDGV
jgi:hypothetical protein